MWLVEGKETAAAAGGRSVGLLRCREQRWRALSVECGMRETGKGRREGGGGGLGGGGGRA